MDENTISKQEKKDLLRMDILKRFDDGTSVGTVTKIHNVNSQMWLLFKKISRLYSNSEGSAFTACVQAWLAVPANEKSLQRMTELERGSFVRQLEHLEQQGKVTIDAENEERN